MTSAVRSVLAQLRGLVPLWPVLGLALLIVLPELALQGADRGWWGSPRWRGLAYAQGAFWIGLLEGWRPNFRAQPVTMFVTHAFLHAGLGHAAMNAVTLLSLGPPLLARLGPGRFALLWAGSILGGGLGFAALAATLRPMVGASGALFGLAGAWLALGVVEGWRAAQAATGREATLRARLRAGTSAALVVLAWPAGMLVLLNLAMMALTPGGIAWQAHFGGGLAGAALAAVMVPRR